MSKDSSPHSSLGFSKDYCKFKKSEHKFQEVRSIELKRRVGVISF